MAVVLISVAAAGCARNANREELAKEVLQADPSFREVLERHRDLTNRIQTLEREIALKRSTVEQSIAQLRKELMATADNVKTKTADLKKRMEPERQRLGLELGMAAEELRAKQAQRASLGRSIVQLQKAIKSGSAAWTAQERAKQEAQLAEMVRDAGRVDQELAAMHSHVRLLKIKLLLIKL